MTEVAFAKNEGRFLLEWLAYHRLVGVTNFLIYTNDCEDESPALFDRLHEMGVVEHFPNPVAKDEKPQKRALARAAEHPLVTGAEYVLQIDLDEFVCVKAGNGRIADLIVTTSDADGICLQMRFFGDNGLSKLPAGLVIENLTGACDESFELSCIIKTLMKNSRAFDRIPKNHMPGFSPEGPASHLFNCAGQEIPADAYNHRQFREIPAAYRSMRYAQLNHYAVKTFDYFCAKKYRGTPLRNDKKLQLSYWRSRNRNEVQDLAIQRHVPATKALMNEWLCDPVLAVCNRRCFEAYDEILKKSADIFQ